MTTNSPYADIIRDESLKWQVLKSEVQKVIIGQDAIIERIFIGLLCNGHILLEGVPGLAKTTLIKTVSQTLGLQFSRIQFTPDLLPSDLIGTLIYNQKTGDFMTKKGPVFANILLADEINRSPAKVQSALLEAMQEHQVTIGDQSFKIDAPFLVLATQNPIDQEGTYHLPEAQVDRFMFKLLVTYPTNAEEKTILLNQAAQQSVNALLSKADILHGQELVNKVYVDEKIVDYIIAIVSATRVTQDNNSELKPFISYGASPRATIALYQAARAYAFLKKRHFVIPEDVKILAPDVLRHRIILSYEAEADHITSNMVVEKILAKTKAP